MKVVINTKKGSFGFSQKALVRLVKLGLPTGNNYKDSVAIVKNANGEYDDVYLDSNKWRTDPKVIQVVEELGQDASSLYAFLKVIDIPFTDTNGWYVYVDEQGKEKIFENHRVWDYNGMRIYQE
jgi:hypothetical protein